MGAVKSYRFSNSIIHMMKGAPCYDYIHNNKYRKHCGGRAGADQARCGKGGLCGACEIYRKNRKQDCIMWIKKEVKI